MQKNRLRMAAGLGPITLALPFLLSACADDGARYKPEVYSLPIVNQSQTTRNVQITAIAPGKVELDKTFVDGVQVTYTLNRVTTTSVQIGKTCEFQIGPALVISTLVNETRIQPNGSCGVSVPR